MKIAVVVPINENIKGIADITKARQDYAESVCSPTTTVKVFPLESGGSASSLGHGVSWDVEGVTSQFSSGLANIQVAFATVKPIDQINRSGEFDAILTHYFYKAGEATS